TVYHPNGGGGKREIYIAYWIRLSPNWTHHPVQDKTLHIWNNRESNFVFLGVRPNGEAWVHMQSDAPARNLQANLNPAASRIVPGNGWYLWETVLRINSGSSGEVHWWITPPGGTAVKVGEYRDVNFGSGSPVFGQIEWAPTWGGLGSSVPQTQSMDIDHIYI